MAPTGYTIGRMYELNLSDISPDPSQPRKYFDEQALAELKVSIQNLGVLQPVLVRGGGDGKFLVVSGERRYHASVAAGRTTIPAILTDGNPVEISIVENLLREDLTAIEEAEAIDNLRNAYGYQLSDLSGILGKAESTISEILSLNKLPDAVKNDCRNDPSTRRRILVEIAKQTTQAKMAAQYAKYKASGLARGEIRARTATPKAASSAVDSRFVASFTKRLTAIEVEKLDQTQSASFTADLDALRLEVNRKLRKLKGTAAPEG